MAGERTRFAVIVERDEAGFWVAEIASVKGCYAQGRSLRHAKKKIREVLAFLTSAARAERAELDFDVRLPREQQQALGAYLRLQAKLDRVQHEAEERRAVLIRALASQDLSRRDIGELLGISHQRVDQLLASA